MATIVVERAFDGLTLMLFVVIAWPFLPWTSVLKTDAGEFNPLWLALSVLVALGFVVGFMVLLLLAISPRFGQRAAGLVVSATPERFRAKVENLFHLLVQGLGALRSPRKLLLISVLSAPVWLLEAAMYYILAISFDLALPFHVVLVVTATSNLATAIPSSMGGIGPFEVVAKSTLIAFGPGTGDFANLVVAYIFFLHIIALWLPVNILGMLFLWKENISIAQLVRSKGLEIGLQPQVQGSSVADYRDGGMAGSGGEEAGEIK